MKKWSKRQQIIKLKRGITVSLFSSILFKNALHYRAEFVYIQLVIYKHAVFFNFGVTSWHFVAFKRRSSILKFEINLQSLKFKVQIQRSTSKFKLRSSKVKFQLQISMFLLHKVQLQLFDSIKCYEVTPKLKKVVTKFDCNFLIQ